LRSRRFHGVSCAWLGWSAAVRVTKKARVKKLARILKRLSEAIRMQLERDASNLTA
jgi:hypothetical protein